MQRYLWLFGILFCYLTSIYAQTQGGLEAIGKNGKALGSCPLKHTNVKAGISGFLARVRVTQEFKNTFEQPIEAVYVFPLPDDAAVDETTMKIGTRSIRAKILKREEARKVYESAKSTGQTASLLDQERPNIFSQAVTNIMPGEKIVIEISYVETLKYDDGRYEFVFPMVVGPRYKPAAMSRAQRKLISPPVAVESRAGHDISLSVSLDAGVPVAAIRSASHAIETQTLIGSRAEIKLKNSNTIPNKDFILRYDVAGRKINDAVMTHSNGKGGYFTVILQPPDKVTAKDVSPKEIVFVLDTSGSMDGFPIEKAKESMKMALDGLYPNDTFNLITFAGDTHILFDKPVPPTAANMRKAQAFLASRTGGGGTEMMKAIKAALEPSSSAEHLRIVCFMTDGYVGNEGEIIAEIQKHPNARVFSFGIGSSVNRFLLDKMALEGRGEVEYVTLDDDGTKAAKRFHERIRNPLLTDISLDWNGLAVADVYPRKLNDLFSAKPLIVHGRYTKSGNGTIRLRGKFAGKDVVRELSVSFPENALENDVLSTLWARTRIDELMSNDYNSVAQNGRTKPEIEQAITQLGIEYRLMTQFTSFIAVEEKVVNKSGKQVRVDVPVELPESVSKLAVQSDDEPPPPVKSSLGAKNLASIINAPSARGTIRPSGTPVPPRIISGGIVNGKAVNLPAPAYPPAAKSVNASGTVSIQVTIDETGNVISASAISGHALLRQSAEAAAKNSKFAPTLISGQPVKTTGVIVYNFVNGNNPASAQYFEPNQFQDEIPPTIAETKLHYWLYRIVERLQKSDSKPTENEARFVREGIAAISITMTAKTPDVIEKLKQLGFEIESEDDLILTGRIAIEKLAQLVEIEEIELIVPKLE
jgi:Ca-activated chloride channel family protein